MRTWRWGVAAGVIVGALVVGLASCGDDNGGGAAAPPALSPDPLNLEIQSATVPASGPPTVRFSVTDGSGAPIDLEAELATTTTFPRIGSAPRFTLAMLDDHGDYVSYFATTTTPRAYTYTPDPEVVTTPASFVPPTPAARTQAQAPAFDKTKLTKVSAGVYDYTFPTPTVTTGLDRTKTHTVAGWFTRRPNAADTDVAFGSFNFVPAGGTAQKLETITDAGCNRCHGALTAHGSRRGTQLCITCHSPQTGDPETNRTVNFKVMIHKIHSGENLPSVQQGFPYYIVGFSQTVFDWSDARVPVARPRRPALHRLPQRQGRGQLEDEADADGLHLVPRQREVHGRRSDGPLPDLHHRADGDARVHQGLPARGRTDHGVEPE